MRRRSSSLALVVAVTSGLLAAAVAWPRGQQDGGAADPVTSDPVSPKGGEPPEAATSTDSGASGPRGEGSGRRVSNVDEALALVRERYPDLVAAAVGLDELSSLLLEGTLNDSGFTDPARLARARLFIAEVDEAIGEPSAARSLWKQAVDAAPTPGLKARGLLELGFHYFLRQRYRDAWGYWKPARELAPDLADLSVIDRYRPFLVMIETGDVPDFTGNFGQLGASRLSDLRGRWVVVHFWTTQVAGAYRDAQLVKAAVNSARNQGWQGTVLGVNLDRDRERFEAALRDWKVDFRPANGGPLTQVPALDWPQHHDGLGFESPIVRALAIPRAPLVLLVDPAGKLRHVTEIRPVETPDGKRRYRYQDSRVLRSTMLEALDTLDGPGDESTR